MRLILVDTNLLLLLVIGSASLQLVSRNPHTKNFALSDFEILEQIVSDYSRIVVVPGILAELSNLAPKNINAPVLSTVMAKFKAMVNACLEIPISSQTAAARPEFERLGIVDAAILEVCAQDRGHVTLLTNDQALAREASRLGLNVENFRQWQ